VVEPAGRLKDHHDWASCLTQHAITTSTPRLRQTTTPKTTQEHQGEGRKRERPLLVPGVRGVIA